MVLLRLQAHTQLMTNAAPLPNKDINPITGKPFQTQSNVRLRRWGYALLVLGAAALAWDAITLLTHSTSLKLSGLMDFWVALDKNGFDVFQRATSDTVGAKTWQILMQPVLSMPLVLLFGLPGFWLTRKHCPDIQVHVPTLDEQKVEALGLARKGRR